MARYIRRSPLPSAPRAYSFVLIDGPIGSAFGTFMCKAEVAFFSRLRAAQLPMMGAAEMALAPHRPNPDRATFADVQYRPSSKSVSERITIGWEISKGFFLKPSLTRLAANGKKTSEKNNRPTSKPPLTDKWAGVAHFRYKNHARHSYAQIYNHFCVDNIE